jgi:hypothetical protein
MREIGEISDHKVNVDNGQYFPRSEYNPYEIILNCS